MDDRHNVRVMLWVMTGCLALAIAWLGLVYTGPVPHLPVSSQWNDKGLHVIVFALAAFIIAAPCANVRPLLMLVTVALAIELLQFWAPGREPGLADFAASTTGVALGWGSGWLARIVMLRLFSVARRAGR